VEKLWKTLDCDTRCGVSIDSVRNIVCAIMNTQPDDPPENDYKINSLGPFCKPTIGKYVNSHIYFSKEETVKMHEEFKELYLNKMSVRKRKVIPEVYTYKPQLSERTIKLAPKSKNKCIELHGKLAERQAALMGEIQKIKAEIDKECTFKPKTTEYSPFISKNNCIPNKGSQTERAYFS